MKRMTNIEFVNSLMEYSQFGAMAQMFVIDALTKMSEAVAKSDPKKDYADGSFVNPEAWIGVAKEIKEKLDKQYGRAT